MLVSGKSEYCAHLLYFHSTGHVSKMQNKPSSNQWTMNYVGYETMLTSSFIRLVTKFAG